MSAPSPAGRWVRMLVATVVAATFVPVSPAAARPTYPSQDQVDAARAAAARRAGEADQLQRRLAVISRQLERLEIAAGSAVEGFNDARAALAAAEEAAAGARAKAAAARAEAEQARQLLGRIAASSYRSGGVLASIGLVLEAEGPAQVFDELGALQTVANSQSETYDRWRQARARAEVAQREADRALADQGRAAERARQARDAAAAAVEDQQRRLAAAEAEREQVMAALAAANRTSVELERRRQEGLRADAERRAREQAERDAQAEADREAKARAEREARTQAERAAAAQQRSTQTTAPTESRSRSQAPRPAATTDAAAPPTSTAPRPSPSSTGDGSVPYDAAAAKRVVAFARAQLGEPYKWGAAGSDAWDCSGLTMMAWRQAGVRLTHGARAQLRETRQISYGQLKPGDLVFHASGSSPSTIHHVGIYIGDGKMIHAPNSSRPVEIKSIFYMGEPGFYSRPLT